MLETHQENTHGFHISERSVFKLRLGNLSLLKLADECFSSLDLNQDSFISKNELDELCQDSLLSGKPAQLTLAIRDNYETLNNFSPNLFSKDKGITQNDFKQLASELKKSTPKALHAMAEFSNAFILDGLELCELSNDQNLKKLFQVRNEKEKELSKSYQVSFSHDNDISMFGLNIHKLRSPRLIELKIIEQSMKKSLPSSRSGKKLHFNFRQDTPGASSYATYSPLTHQIHINSLSIQDFLSEAGAPSDAPSVLELSLLHEEAHVTMQSLIGAGKLKLEDYAPRLGWQIKHWGPIERQTIKDKNGNYWENAGSSWRKVNYRLSNPYSWGAKPEYLSGEELMSRLFVPPITNYFSDISEELAEALMYFRANPYYRQQLLLNSKTLYDCAKEIDQLDLTNKHSSLKHRQGK